MEESDPDSEENEWEPVNQEEMTAVRELEAVAHSAPNMGIESWWACAHCPAFHDWGDGIKTHLAQK